jgi:hypothetical protein
MPAARWRHSACNARSVIPRWDDSFAPGIGHRLDGWANRDLNVGAIVSLAPDLSALTTLLGVDEPAVKKVLASWRPGKFDAQLNVDGKAFRPDGNPAATLIPPAFGLAGDVMAVVNHYNQFLKLSLTDAEKARSDRVSEIALTTCAPRGAAARLSVAEMPHARELGQCVVHEGEERDGGRVGAQGARAEADALEAVRRQQVALEVVPAAFRADRQHHAFVAPLPHRVRRASGRRRIAGETQAAASQTVEIVFDERFELPVDRDVRQPRIPRLLQTFDEQRAVTRRREHVRVEVVALHARRIGHHDAADAERRDRSPEPPHHFRPREGEDQIDARPHRRVRRERAAEHHRAGGHRGRGARPARSIEYAETHPIANRDLEDVQQMIGAGVGEQDDSAVADFRALDQNEIHDAWD